MLRDLRLAALPVLVFAVTGCAAGGLTIDAAQRLENGGDSQGALTQYDQAIQEKPKLAIGYKGRGRCLLALRMPKDAEQAFRDATKAEPLDVESKVMLANVLEQRKGLMEAEIQLKEAYQLDPKNLSVVSLQGKVLEDGGKLKEAAEKYKEAIALDPNNTELHQSLAHCYGLLNQFDDAKKEFAVIDKIKLQPKKS